MRRTWVNSRMNSTAAKQTRACWCFFRRLDRSACGGPPHSKQYWDRNRVLSHAMGEHDRPSVVWDYIAVYKPEEIWTDAPPQPEFTGRPVVRFIDGTRRALNTIYSEQKKLN